ncbi:hypothetical protein [Lentzea sp. NPDC060358]|uniref:hypothetical protein n=1 Tax=Lentzea sp. NPDC060358 TaxID=3347103 RepID=UPI00365EE0AE
MRDASGSGGTTEASEVAEPGGAFEPRGPAGVGGGCRRADTASLPGVPGPKAPAALPG